MAASSLEPSNSAPADVRALRPARWLLRLLMTTALIQGVVGGSVSLVHRQVTGDLVPSPTAFIRIELVALASIALWILSAIATGLTWIIWLRHSYDFASGTTSLPYKLPYKKGWATWGWFVPIFSLFRPLQLHRAINSRIGIQRGGTVPLDILGWWWFAFLALGAVTGLLELGPETAVLTPVISVAAASLAMVVVAGMTERQTLAVGVEPEEYLTWGRVKRRIALTIGLALSATVAMIILWPHGGDEVFGIEDVAVGTCFNNATTEGFLVRTECSEPHDGEVLSVAKVSDRTYPGQVEFDEYMAWQCVSALEVRLGVPIGEDANFDVLTWTPNEILWESGTRVGACLGIQADGRMLDEPMPSAAVERVALAELTKGCYLIPDQYTTLESLPCSAGGVEILGIVVHDTMVAADFPGEQQIFEEADAACPVGTQNISSPTSFSWRLGDRVSLCFAE